MPPIGYITRCYVCSQKLSTTDDYGDYGKLVQRDGKLVRKSEERWFDPDWVIHHHIQKHHS